MDMGIVEDESV